MTKRWILFALLGYFLAAIQAYVGAKSAKAYLASQIASDHTLQVCQSAQQVCLTALNQCKVGLENR